MWAFNRLISLLLGIALFGAGVVAAVNGVLALAGRQPAPAQLEQAYAVLTGTLVRDPAVWWSAVGVGVVGVILLVAQLRPWAPSQLPVGPPGPCPDTWSVQRRSVEQHLAAAAETVTGVRAARVRLRGRGTRWRLAVSAEGRPDTRPALEHAVRAELSRLWAPVPLRLRLSLRKPRSVA